MSPPNGNGAAPDRVSVRLHQVGFGDCVLLSLGYPQPLADGRDERHVLFDFGSTHWPRDGGRHGFELVADSVAQRTGDKLDVLVITHRHRDHVSGFADNEAAATIAGLAPDLVLRPWTEDPAVASDATLPAHLGPRSREHVRGLAVVNSLAQEVVTAFAGRDGAHAEIVAAASEELPNLEAVQRIDALAAGGRGRYLCADQDAGTTELLPGVEVSVLGPPTVEQWPRVADQREEDEEYWMFAERSLRAMLEAAAVPARTQQAAVAALVDEPLDPGPVRWLVERLHDQQLHALLRLTREFDKALNNTSVLLLLKVGGRRLLFPGDAQIENWSYALDGESTAHLREGLDEIDLYKVGHHGSRNATPRSLVGGWRESGRHVASVMSTMPGVHGRRIETRVPRLTLCDALEEVGTLFRSDAFAPDQVFLDVGGDVRGSDPFAAL